MAYCSKCGKEVAESTSFCSSCGEKVSNVQNNIQNPSLSSAINDEDFSTFIGKNASHYITKFKKFNTGGYSSGIDNFQPTWHWPAFFVSFLWLLYRKLYLWALLVFCLFIIPGVGFIVMIVFGITGNYIYYKHAKKRILALKGLYKSSDAQGAIEIARAGGVSNIAVVVISILLTILVIGILAAIAIPQFNSYRQRGYCVGAISDLKNSYVVAIKSLEENPQKIISDINDLSRYGLQKTNEDNIISIDNFSYNDNGGRISATHPQCNKIYHIDPRGDITESLK